MPLAAWANPPARVKHPDTGQGYSQFSWPLYQSGADLALIERVRANQKQGVPLSDQDREQLLAAFGPLTGKALAYPASLTSDERRTVKGWPDTETRQANLEAVGLGHMTAEEVMAKAQNDAGWMTLEQANLVRQRFNARPLDALDWKVDGFDKGFAVEAVQTEEEGMTYVYAHVRWRELSGLDVWEDSRRNSRARFAELAAKRKDLEERMAKGQLTKWELRIEKSKEDSRREKEARKLAEEKRMAELQAVYGTGLIGFGLYKTQELMDLLDEYWEQAADWRDGFFRGKKDRLFQRALKKSLEGEDSEFHVMHKAVTGETEWPLHYKIGTKMARELVAPAAAASVFRHDHRTNRGQDMFQGNYKTLHPRYFLVWDRHGFPALDNILKENTVVLPEVWVYDAEWEPPADGDGIRDADGYEGRLRVRFTYNVHVHFWPLIRQDGFDMKKIWMEQEDHTKPYPFPGHDVTYDNVREKVPWTSDGVPADVWAQFQEAVAKGQGRPAGESEPISEEDVVLELPPNFKFPPS
ncbi:hypothetical protein PG985_005398 [Apiospora marii]|uniref:uncharacterized protein n=1 Tax=Apiospora marii TaxID=335849 RepID=UPI00312EA37B